MGFHRTAPPLRQKRNLRSLYPCTGMILIKMADEQEPDRGVDLDQSQFCCSVCLDLLREPVAIPCGHSYCKSCIEGCWDQEDKKGQYSCPQCRETFSPRPGLRRNNMLAEVVEKLKRTSTQQPPLPLDFTGPGDVACDFCCGPRPNKATVSCLACLASYCPAHLEAHHSVPVLKKHQLVSATMPLQEKMCTKHNKLMEVYCQTDKKCICYLCVIDEHKSHSTVSAASERAAEQKQLIDSQKKVQGTFLKKEKELDELLQTLKDFKSCSGPAAKACDTIFDELIASMMGKRTLARQLIEAQEKAAVAVGEELQLQLEEEISKLKTGHAELERLSHTDDHVRFIQAFQSLSKSCDSPDSASLVFYPQRSAFKPVTDCVSKLREDIESLLKDSWPRISATVSSVDVMPPILKTREDFLRFCRPLTLDERSISQYMSISQEGLRVTSQYNHQPTYYDSPSNNLHIDRLRHNQLSRAKVQVSRAKVIMQVLCTEGLSERSYWEVFRNGLTWSVAVSCKDRSARNEFGNDVKSWSLECSPNGYSFRHNNRSTRVSGPQSKTIGVYLDYNLGALSFYSVFGNSLTLLHKVQATFTGPVYPGLGLKDDDTSRNDLTGYYAELIKLW